MEVIPGILEKDWSEIERKIELVKGFAKTVHIDIIDGKFVNNTTFLDPQPFKKYAKDLFFELHMMVEEPLAYLKPFAAAGFKRFLGHVEKMSSGPTEFIAQGQLLGEVGLAIDGKTPLDAITVPFDDLDCLLIMTINAGFSGQSFKTELLGKVRQALKKSSTLPIEVDGGINDQTILEAKQAGATHFVATSFIFNSLSPKIAFEKLESLI